MPARRTARLAVATIAGMAAGLGAACGDDDPSTAGTTTIAAADGTTTTSGAEFSTTTTAAPGSTGTPDLEGEGISELEALASELLVLGPELGVPAEDQGYTPPGPAACGFDLDEAHPADVHVGTTQLTPNGTFEEVLRVYTDTDAARDAFDAAVGHEAECAFADREVEGPVDINDRVGADGAVQFSASDRSGNTVRIVTRVADALVTFSLAGQVGFVLDPVEVAAFGVGKILAALEA